MVIEALSSQLNLTSVITEDDWVLLSLSLSFPRQIFVKGLPLAADYPGRDYNFSGSISISRIRRAAAEVLSEGFDTLREFQSFTVLLELILSSLADSVMESRPRGMLDFSFEGSVNSSSSEL